MDTTLPKQKMFGNSSDFGLFYSAATFPRPGSKGDIHDGEADRAPRDAHLPGRRRRLRAARRDRPEHWGRHRAVHDAHGGRPPSGAVHAGLLRLVLAAVRRRTRPAARPSSRRALRPVRRGRLDRPRSDQLVVDLRRRRRPGHPKAAAAGRAARSTASRSSVPSRSARDRKIRVGTKISFHSEADPDLRFGRLARRATSRSATRRSIPTTATATSTLSTPGTADWEWGGAVSKAMVHRHGVVPLVGHRGRRHPAAEHPALRLRRRDPDPPDSPPDRSRSTTTSSTAATSAEPNYADVEHRRPLLVRPARAGHSRPPSTSTSTCSSTTASTRTPSAGSSA